MEFYCIRQIIAYKLTKPNYDVLQNAMNQNAYVLQNARN